MLDYWNESKVVRGQLLQYCASLVEQDHLSAVIRYVHPSIKKYLKDYFRPFQYQAVSLLFGELYKEAETFSKVGREYYRDVCFRYLNVGKFGSHLVIRNAVETKFSRAEVLDQALSGSHVTR